MSIFSCPLLFLFLPVCILFPYLPRPLLLCSASFLPSPLISFWQERRFDYPTVTPASGGQIPRRSCLCFGSQFKQGATREKRFSGAGERASMAPRFPRLFSMHFCKNGAKRKCVCTLFAAARLTFVYGVPLPSSGSKRAGDAARQCQGAGPVLPLPLARSLD